MEDKSSTNAKTDELTNSRLSNETVKDGRVELFTN